MLKNISPIISPELLKILMEMGHSDEIVIGDGNFPAASIAQRLVRLDGHGVPEVLDAVLKLMPLDTYVDAPVALMDNNGDGDRPAVWDKYEEIVKATRTSSSWSASLSMTEQERHTPSSRRARPPYTQTSSSKRAL